MKRLDKVLILEDSPMMQSLYRMVFDDAGVELAFAENGEEGLDRVARESFQLLIVDINMPRMDGITFLRELRRSLGRTDVPAVVVSTECSEEDRRTALEAGADAYLCKPWSTEELLSVIDSALEAYR